MFVSTTLSLQSENSKLRDDISTYETAVDLLTMPRLFRVNFAWSDNHPLLGSPYVNFHGTVFNSGSDTANDVICTVRIYDVSDTLLKTHEIALGDIQGDKYQSFDVDITYSGDADHVTDELSKS